MKEYKIVNKVGEGSFGLVFKCYNQQHGVVAVKQTKQKYEGSKDRLNKLEEVRKLLLV